MMLSEGKKIYTKEIQINSVGKKIHIAQSMYENKKYSPSFSYQCQNSNAWVSLSLLWSYWIN